MEHSASRENSWLRQTETGFVSGKRARHFIGLNRFRFRCVVRVLSLLHRGPFTDGVFVCFSRPKYARLQRISVRRHSSKQVQPQM